MRPKYVVHYTLFGLKYNGFKSYYRFFETEEQMKMFIEIKNIKDSCIIFKNINIGE